MLQKIKSLLGIKSDNLLSVYDVFTPTKPATYTFVEREKVNKELVNAIKTPGKQIVVYGHSGSGKSTLLINKLKGVFNHNIVSRCTKTTKFNDLILDCFDQMNTYYVNQYTTSQEKKVSGEVEGSTIAFKGKFGGEASISDSKDYNRISPVQLNPRRLAISLKEQNCCWIIEDFHKVEDEDKKQLADVMKLFTDMETKVIAIGAAGTAREVMKQNPEMQNRVAEILVPLMNDDELKGIIEKGEKSLNIKIEESVKRSIIKFSSGLAAVCHQLCLNICREKDIETTNSKLINLTKEDFGEAINSYVSDIGDTLKAIFDRAIKVEDDDVHGMPEKILKCMLIKDNDEFSIQDIREHLELVYEYSYSSKEVKSTLNELESDKRGSIIRYDDNSNKYSFTNPFFTAYSCCLLRNELEEIESKEIKKKEAHKGKGDIVSGSKNVIINSKNSEIINSNSIIIYKHNFKSNKNYIRNYCYDYLKIDTRDIEERLEEVLENWDKYDIDKFNKDLTKEDFKKKVKEYLEQLKKLDENTGHNNA